MKAKIHTHCLALIAATLAVGGCDAVNDAVDNVANNNNDAEVHYYLSVGTSLSVGVQPGSTGIALPTDDGYADTLFDSIKPAFDSGGARARDLFLVKLGCPGETLDKMINGGSCLYVAGSQLDAAVDFLTDHGNKVHLVTIDMGGNDFRDEKCMNAVDIPACANAVSAQISLDLAVVLAALRDAASPGTTIIGMNYYNPYLSSWLEGPDGQTLAMQSAEAVNILNGFLGTTYATAGMPMADVSLAFESNDFTKIVASSQPPPNDLLPVSVNNICELTYMCDPDPIGPDIHANRAGYGLIADTLEGVLP